MEWFKRKRRTIFQKLFVKQTPLEKFYDTNFEFIWYVLISLVCTGVLYVLYFVINNLTNGNYMVANFISYTISFSLLFYWDQLLFKSKPKHRKKKYTQLITFIIIRVIGFPIDSYILYLLINKCNMSIMIAKVVGSLIMFAYNFITNKLFVFKKIN